MHCIWIFRQYQTKPASVDVKQRKAPRSFNLQIPSTTNSELTWVQSSKKAKESSLVRVRSYVCGMSVSVPEDLRASEFTELGKNFCLFVRLFVCLFVCNWGGPIELRWAPDKETVHQRQRSQVWCVCGMSDLVPEDLRVSEFTELGKSFCFFVTEVVRLKLGRLQTREL